MRCSKIALAAALAVGSLLPIGGIANATILSTGLSTAAADLNLVDQVQFVYEGHKHCWYRDGWHGPGWYWCGYRTRRGFGWGGEEGYRGWKHR
jgi:hypothetical protein